MELKKCFLLLASITIAFSAKVQIVCHNKIKGCDSDPGICDKDLGKLLCRKTCDFCKCEDSNTPLCKAEDICNSQEGKLLCPKKCNACEFKYIDTDEPKKPEEEVKPSPEEKDQNKNKENEDKSKEEQDKTKEKEEKSKEEQDKTKEKEDKSKEKEDKSKEKEDKSKEKEDKSKEEEDKSKENGQGDENKVTSENESENPDTESSGDLSKDCIDRHNKYRGKHDSGDLTWDKDLASGAQKWAEKLLADDNLQHASQEEREGAGENLYMHKSTSEFKDPACQVATDEWYKEILDYDFESDAPDTAKTGHFTQVVWKGTSKLGCGVAKGKKEKMNAEYVCCRYKDAGNVMGQYKENVPKVGNPKAVIDEVAGGKDKTGSKRNFLKRFDPKVKHAVL